MLMIESSSLIDMKVVVGTTLLHLLFLEFVVAVVGEMPEQLAADVV